MRLTASENNISILNHGQNVIQDLQQKMQERMEGVIWKACRELQGHVKSVEHTNKFLQVQVKDVETATNEFQKESNTKFEQLFKQGETFEEQLKFLMEAAEMVKRRLREHQKSQTARFKEVEEAEEKLSEQIA